MSGYRIYRDGVLIRDTTKRTFTDEGLAIDTEYSYYIKAYDGAGNESDASMTVTAKTPDGWSIDKLDVSLERNRDGYIIESYINYNLIFRIRVKREIKEYVLGTEGCFVATKQDYVIRDDNGKILVDSTHEGAVLEEIPCIVISIPKKTFKSEGVVEMAVCDKKNDNNEIWSNWFSTSLKMIQL